MRKSIIVVTIALSLVVNANAALASAVTSVVKEAEKHLARKAGRVLGGEVIEHGAKETAEFLAKHGEQGAALLRRFGPEVAQQAARHGDDVARLCAGLGDDAARYALRNMEQALPIWRRFGTAGVEMFAKHPGLGGRALETFGKDAVALGSKLSAERLQQVLILAAKCDGKQRQTLLEAVLKHGDAVLDFLWRNKATLLTGAAIYGLLKEYETRNEASDGVKQEARVTRQNGVSRLAELAWNKLLDAYPMIPLALLGLGLFVIWPALSMLRSLLHRLERMLRRERSKRELDTKV